MASDTHTSEDSHFSVEVASLSDDGQAQVVEGMHDGLSADDALAAAQESDAHREAIEHFRDLQAHAADSGDYTRAHDAAQDAEYHMQAVNAEGGDMDAQIISADADQLNLEVAHSDQQAAHDDAFTASSYAQAGDADHAQQYGAVAHDEAANAQEHGHAADAGGTETDHDASITTE